MGCICDHYTIVVDPGPDSDPCEDCLNISSSVVGCPNSIGPCGETGTIELTTNCVAPTWSIVYHDPAFENVAIDGDGTLTYDTVEGEATPNTYYDIIYKVTCGDEEFVGLGVIGTAKSCIKNLCSGVNCDEGEVCDECTGLCGPAGINLQLNIV